jgi:NAD(P)-dependent dehydrogenase (short-subunit alcohol dehydrogenase family)
VKSSSPRKISLKSKDRQRNQQPLSLQGNSQGTAHPFRITTVREASLRQRGKMNLGLQGKVAVVSGSTAGIGWAIAAALAAEGAKVIVNGRTQARVDAAVKSIQQRVANSDLRGVAADLGTASGVEIFLRQVPAADVLVNNLGIFDPKPFTEIPDADWMRFFEVNVLSGVRLSRAYLPGMLQNNWGRVIFISSESAQHIPPEMIHYGMTKTAQVAVARGLAESVAGTGVTVNSVLVGPTASEGATTFIERISKEQKLSKPEVEKWFFQNVRPTSLLKRFETPEEVASVVAFVAGTQSIAINGAAVRAEGGVVRSIF